MRLAVAEMKKTGRKPVIFRVSLSVERGTLPSSLASI